ncbi:sulfotransferase domain-containing protein [Bacteroidota bacterium]
MKNIIWLASYPKSGNTWFRTFVSNLRYPKAEPADIKALGVGMIGSARGLFDEFSGIEASDLTPEEIKNLRPHVFEAFSDACEEIQHMKIHDELNYTSEGLLDVSIKATRGAIYLVRNPLDVAVSFAHHNNQNVSITVESMNQPDYAFCKTTKSIPGQLKQTLNTWSNHVLSWADTTEFPVHIVRYEDMLNKPFETFTAAAKFGQLPHDKESIERAIKFSSFKELQKQEAEEGFYEKNHSATSPFFRKGKTGSWREELTAEQAQIIIENHREIMLRFGYITADGKPVY